MFLYEGVKEECPPKSRYFTAIGSPSVKAVADRHIPRITHLTSNCCSSTGAVYEAISRPRTAFRYYLQSLETTEQLGDVVGQARAWLQLGHLLKNADNGSVSAGFLDSGSCYRAALRLTSGDVARLRHISTATKTKATTML